MNCFGFLDGVSCPILVSICNRLLDERTNRNFLVNCCVLKALQIKVSAYLFHALGACGKYKIESERRISSITRYYDDSIFFILGLEFKRGCFFSIICIAALISI